MLVDVDHNDSDDRLAVMLLACQAHCEGRVLLGNLVQISEVLMASDVIVMFLFTSTRCVCEADQLSVAGVETESASQHVDLRRRM